MFAPGSDTWIMSRMLALDRTLLRWVIRKLTPFTAIIMVPKHAAAMAAVPRPPGLLGIGMPPTALTRPIPV
jgi:hypothetical protein